MIPASRVWKVTVALVCGGAFLACAASSDSSRKRKPAEGDDGFFDEGELEEEPLNPSRVDDDSGAFGPAGSRPAEAGAKDAGSDTGVVTRIPCIGPMLAGDLAIVELMVSSRGGSGDDGEWVEIENRRPCWLSIKGVTVESPRGAAVNSATVTQDWELAPGATFVVANTLDTTKNHALPGKVISWEVTDVLKNDGDTVTVKSGTTVIDSLTFPGFSNLEPGRALAFPSDCNWNDRASWARWSLAFDAWTPGFKGTPNGENADVLCF